jgi:hypothetical protein
LQVVRLSRSYLDLADMFAGVPLAELEILIDERQTIKEGYSDLKSMEKCRPNFFKHRIRLNNSQHFLDLLKMFPSLKTLRFGWNKNHCIGGVPDDFIYQLGDELEDLEKTGVLYKGPFYDCSGKLAGLPQIQCLEIYNFHADKNETDGFFMFIKALSDSGLKDLKFLNYKMEIPMLMKVLENTKLMETLTVHMKEIEIVRKPKSSGKSEAPTKSKTAPFVYDNLKSFDVHFENLNDRDLIGDVFAAVPNIKALKSNLTKDVVQEFIASGKFSALEAIEETTHTNLKIGRYSVGGPCESCDNLNDKDKTKYNDYADYEIDGYY